MSDPIRAAMASVSREDFLPEGQRAQAAIDAPLPIGWGQTNSQPHTVEAMLRLLEVGAGMRVLDVGAGSGWTTALLAHLVGESGSVVGVEIVPQLRERATAALGRFDPRHARVELAERGVLGWPVEAPYDRVLVSAAARSLPTPLVEQLGDGGILVVPVRGVMTRVVRGADGSAVVTEHGAYRFVPLLDW
ncbi:protein-L-isoaspartate O-methyltransferase [Mumia zhuanghuii]|uniref:Protein-L-isoaspartate O-methyltransferase n=2 Tax=Mumia TaxID=1546255 RepID=A0ABW1QH23_9ACTN|nr:MULTISPECIES: protein-L-isoaspartate O-methyltransferase [Mumia]KAA1422848.1 protein-L-isoaspartate O-methyltransferase [Mumia zhuanghuii]